MPPKGLMNLVAVSIFASGKSDILWIDQWSKIAVSPSKNVMNPSSFCANWPCVERSKVIALQLFSRKAGIEKISPLLNSSTHDIDNFAGYLSRHPHMNW